MTLHVFKRPIKKKKHQAYTEDCIDFALAKKVHGALLCCIILGGNKSKDYLEKYTFLADILQVLMIFV
jgi:hypothetical protein